MKTREWKTREWKTWHQNAWVENPAVETAGMYKVRHGNLQAVTVVSAVADLGFGKGECPIHQKGAPEGAKPRHAR